MKALLAAIIACAVLAVRAQDGREDWIVTVQEIGGSGRLDCFSQVNDTNVTYSVYGWMFPDLTVVNTTYNDTRRWVEDQWTFVITNMSRTDIGQYHCMLLDESDAWFLVKLGLNMKGPYFQDLWEMYRMNTIVGLSAFFGFLVLVLIIWLFYHFRWVDPEIESKRAPQNGGPMYDNPSFQEDGIVKSAPAKDDVWHTVSDGHMELNQRSVAANGTLDTDVFTAL